MLAGISRSVGTMSCMLNSLLDINRLESGPIVPSLCTFPIKDVFDFAIADFCEPAKEKGLILRIVQSGVFVRSDQRMLEEMLRNLLSNAIRYTDRGKILVGCRRADDKVRIEVWDSGAGIMESTSTEYSKKLSGSGKSGPWGFRSRSGNRSTIGKLLGHHVDVRSTPGKGSGFPSKFR